jgi:hypothetical protein
VPLRRIQRSIYEQAGDVARALAKTEAFERSHHDRKRVEMLFAHLKRIFRLGRLRLRPDVWGAPQTLFGVFGTTWYHKLSLPARVR